MATAKLVIKGEDQLKGPLKQAQNELTGFESVAKKVGDTLKTAFTVAAIVKGVQELAKAVAECVKEFKEQVEIDTRLDAVLKATGQQYKYTTQDIKKYSQALQEQTRFGDEVIEQSAQLLVATQKFSKEGLERTLELSADLAEAMGTDLTSATSTLSKALIEPGEGLNRLKTIGISFTDEEEKMIKALREAGDELGAQQVILDKVEAAYGGVAKSVGELDTSKLDKIKSVWGDLKQDLGKAFTSMFGGLFDFVYDGLKRLQRLANQIAEQGSFNKYLANNDIRGLADNFTTDFLQSQLKKEQYNYDKIAAGLKDTWSSVFHDLRVDFETDFDQFVRLDRKTQTAYLRDLYPDNYMKVDAIVTDINNSIGESVRILQAIELQEKDVFKSAQAAAAAAEASAEAAEAAQIASDLENIMKKYGSHSGIYTTGNLTNDLASVDALLQSGDLETSDYDVLVEIRNYLLSQLPDKFINTLSRTMEEANAWTYTNPNNILPKLLFGEGGPSTYMNTMMGLNGGAWLTTTEAFMDTFTRWETDFDVFVRKFGEPDRQSGLGFNFGITSGDFGLKQLSLDFQDTMSILGPDKVKQYLDFGDQRIQEALKSFGSYSESYQSALLQQNIDAIQNILDNLLEPGTTLYSYFEEIVKELKGKQNPDGSGSSSSSSGGGSGMYEWGKKFGENMDKLMSDIGNTLFDDFKSQLGQAGDLINKLTNNMAQFGPILGAIITALHYVIEGFVETIGPILEDFVQWGLEPLREFGRMIGQIITPILEEIMPSVIATGKVLMNLFGAIARLLTPIVETLMRVIGPILSVLADVLVTIIGTISWAIDWLAYCITWVLNKVTFGWVQQSANPGGLNDYLSNMYADPTSSYSSAGMNSTGVTNASYQGGTVIHLNIYQNGVVCGDNGILEFATMIKNELADVAYYGR